MPQGDRVSGSHKTGKRKAIEAKQPLSEDASGEADRAAGITRVVCGKRQPRSGAVCHLDPGHVGDHCNAAGGQWTESDRWTDDVF